LQLLSLLSRIACAAAFASSLYAQTGATFGDVINLGGTPSDIVLDESRKRLYLVNAAANRLDVWDYNARALLDPIAVGTQPLAAAMSMDNAFLYVTNNGSSTLSVIDLNFLSVVNTVTLPAKPEGVEVGFDGRVLISTDGTGASNLNNTLLLYDASQSTAQQVIPVVFPPPPPTPTSLQTVTARPLTLFRGKLARTPDGKYIVGVSSVTNNTSTVTYVFEVTSGVLLQSRTVTGQSTTLSISPDGSSFMAGFTLYDIASLNVLAQANTANSPFPITGTFATATNVGGSVFAPDGSVLYNAFNSTPSATPTPPPNASTLLISDPKNLAIRLGIKLPESVVAKLAIASDGSEAWGLSESGLIHMPLGHLYDNPILMPESTTVFLAQDPCNPGIATGALKILNAGGGKLTYNIPATPTTLVVQQVSGLAPSVVNFTMDPGRSGVLRFAGTNLYTGNNGTPLNVNLISNDAINVPPTIRVYMNYRQNDQRGVVHPVATVPNVPVATGATADQQGLEDILLDEPRGRVYITNAGYNRIEVFDVQQGRFVDPIPVGQLPRQMAMGLDGSTLYVANTGGETIGIVDLDQQAVVDRVQFPPIPRIGNGTVTAGNNGVNSVGSLAVGLSGLEFVVTNPTNNTGTLWKVVGSNAVPRTPSTITGITNGAQTPLAAPSQKLVASPDGSSITLLSGNGTAYVYDALADSYTTSRTIATGTITGYYGPLTVSPTSRFVAANGVATNPALAPLSVVTTPTRNVAAVAPMDDTTFVRLTTPVRANVAALATATTDDNRATLEIVNTHTGAVTTGAVMPENPPVTEFGTGRQAVPPRQMVVDSKGTAYAITLSGLSVVPLALSGTTPRPLIATGARGVVNSSDGTNVFTPGSFITVNGTNLASASKATQLPPPTVLGGSCVVFNDVAIPLLQSSGGQLSGQIPSNMRPGTAVVRVKSLATAQQSDPVVVTIQKP
jgi:YVTN family beta-propeller protein